MAVRIPWDRYEVALLFNTYVRIENGGDYNTEAVKLSQTLRELSSRRGVSIDDTFRNVNGMKMQLANVQYLFSNGGKGLSGASELICQMYDLYKNDKPAYQAILMEAIRLTDKSQSVKDNFLAYARGKTNYSSEYIIELLSNVDDFCHLKNPLLETCDISIARKAFLKVADSGLFRIRFRKEAQQIRNIAWMYYDFLKNYESYQLENHGESTEQKLQVSSEEQATRAEVSTEESITIRSDATVENETVAAHDVSLDDGAVIKNNVDEEAYQLITDPASYQGSTPAYVFAHFCEAFCRLYPLKMRLLVGEEYGDTGEIVINKFESFPYVVKLTSITGFVNIQLTVDEATKYGKWICAKCSGNDSSTLITDPKEEKETSQVETVETPDIDTAQFYLHDDYVQIEYDGEVDEADGEIEQGDIIDNEQDDQITKDPQSIPAAIQEELQAYDIKDTVQAVSSKSFQERVEEDFKDYMLQKGYAESTAIQYCRIIENVEQFINENNLPYTLDGISPTESWAVIRALRKLPEFQTFNMLQHQRCNAALKRYTYFLMVGHNTSSKEQIVEIPEDVFEDENGIEEDAVTENLEFDENQQLDDDLKNSFDDDNNGEVVEADICETDPFIGVLKRKYSLVDFDRDISYARTFPLAYAYKGNIKLIDRWGKFYVDIIRALFQDYPDMFRSLINRDTLVSDDIIFADAYHTWHMRSPVKIAPDFFMEGNISGASFVVQKIGELCQYLGIEDKIKIAYFSICDVDDNQTDKIHHDELIIAELKNRGLQYRDNRKMNGCLWIPGGHELDEFVEECKQAGYNMNFMPNGCKTYPNQNVWWTKDTMESTVSVGVIDDFDTHSEHVDFEKSQAKEDSDSVGEVFNSNDESCEEVLTDAGHANQENTILDDGERMSIKDVTIKVLKEAGVPLTMQEIMEKIEEQKLYTFNSNNPTQILYHGIRRHCNNMWAPDHSPVNTFDRFTDKNGQVRYMLISKDNKKGGSRKKSSNENPSNKKWNSILQDSFPDGYILNDILSQFQAAAFWQERYKENCPLQGKAIDELMKVIGVVRDGRVYSKNEEDKELISSICKEVNSILSSYTEVYRICIYTKYQEKLAACQIYTEQVMTQQLLNEAKGSFYSTNQVFAKRGQDTSVIQDARKVLREHGGAMPVGDIANVLWFIPRDIVYHYLSVDDESLNIGNSTWMLAEHFPLTKEDAEIIGNSLDEFFINNDYLQAFDLMPLLHDRLPDIAENLSGMNYMAVFNIVSYYLKDRFGFTKAIISPKGTNIEFTDLFRRFADDHDTFTLTDLESFASELKLPIYWEITYDGGAVRVSEKEFVNKKHIHFDVEAIDTVLSDFCPGDYLPLQAVTSAMLMHLPSCGYMWNGFLLQSYVHKFSKVFRLSYSSFSKAGFYGAMVRRNCKTITNYGSLIERVLTDDNTWKTTADALDLLVKQGYQILRKYKGIDNVVEKARQNKLMNEGR